MKKTILSLFFVSLFAASSVASAQTATANSGANSSAGATAVAMPVVNTGANAGAYTGGSSAGIEQSFITNSKSQVPMTSPPSYGGTVVAPQLFQLEANPAAMEIAVTMLYEKMCGPIVYTQGNSAVMPSEKGKSGNTLVQITPWPGSARPGVVVTSVSSAVPEGQQVVCGGIIQADGLIANMSASAVLHDGRTSLLGRPGRKQHAYVLSLSEAVVASLGVSGEGNGYNFGVGGATSPTSMLSIFGISAGKSAGEGTTKPVGFPRVTFLVFYAADPDEAGITFQTKDFSPRTQYEVAKAAAQPPAPEVKPVATVVAKPSAAVAPQPDATVVAKPSASSIDADTLARALKSTMK